MKVECAACQAKYQIPDERVAGRKLKIRCRKCSGSIIVRGDRVGAVESAEPAHEGHHTSDEWHVSVEGEQHGPYSGDQMTEMLRAGQLGWDAHVWRDGYPDWKTAGESETLVRSVGAAHDTPATGVVSAGFDDDPTRMVQGSSPPSEGLHPVARGAFAERAAHQSQPGLADVSLQPASQPPQGYEVSQPVEFGYPGPRVGAEQAMTGERHEDSVLFSARNLQARVQSSPPSQRPGYADAEGSGLIDIRALAALARTNQAPAMPATNGASHANGGYQNGHGRDDVMTIAHQTGAFGRLDSLAPMDQPARASSNAVPIAIVAGSALVAVAAFLGVYMTRTPEAAQPEVAITGAGEQPGIAAAAQPTAPSDLAADPDPDQAAEAEAAAQPDEAEEPTVAEAAEGDEAEGEEDAAEREDHTASRRRAASARSRSSGSTRSAREARPAPRAPKAVAEKRAPVEQPPAASAKESGSSPSIDDLLLAEAKPEKDKLAAAATPTEQAAPAPAKPAEPARNRSIDELLASAVDGKGKPKAEAAAAAVALPESPSRDEVLSAMKSVESDVKACADGQTLESPTATVAIGVSGATGRVTSVRVTGIQGTVGSCIARAVRGASFPKFAKSQFSINFPFRLK